MRRARLKQAAARWGETIGAALAAFGVAAGLLLWQPPFASRLDDLAYDAWLTIKGPTAPHPALAVIDIDEKSLNEFGQWPWPRHLLAALIDTLLANGAAAVGLDMLLREPDRTSPARLGEQMEARFGISPDFGDLPPQALDNDQLFHDAIAGRPVVLGAYALFDEGGAFPEALPPTIGLVERTPAGAPAPTSTMTAATGLLTPLPLFSEVAPVAVINASLQTDGVVRKVPLLVKAKERVYPALSLRTLMAALKRRSLRLDSDADGLASLTLGKINIPVGHDGSFRPVYRGPGFTYPYYSAADALAGRLAPEDVAGRLLFIGSSATGLKDMRATPFDPAMPGVEVHTTIADNILNGLHVRVPAYAPGLQLMAIALAALLAAIFFERLPAVAYVPLAVLLLGGCLGGSWLFFTHGLFVSPNYAALAVILAAILILPARFWREERGRRQLKRAFSRYVSPEVVSRIAAQGGQPFAGEQKEITILFTDVRNFTTISEKLAPHDLVRLLNSYFTPMTACVTAREGTLDKFIGDALMAFWNAPLDVAAHQRKAVDAALAMQRALDELRPHFLEEFGVEMRMGAGLHCGPAQVGNMGSRDLLDYTCIGDTVNLGSRLEGMCKRYGAAIVVSAPVRAACGDDVRFRPLDRIRVKGSSVPLDIYQPFQPDAPVEDSQEKKWQDALALYMAGQFAPAQALFAGLAALPAFQTAAALFLERCAQLLAQPPQSWDGVWTYDAK